MHALLPALVLAVASPVPPASPTGDGDPHPRIERAAEAAPHGLLVRLERTRLVAVNRSSEPFVLVLAAPGRGALVARALAPGALVEAWHPPHGLAGLSLELLAAPGGRLASSGSLVLDGRELTLLVHAGEGGPGSEPLTLVADRAVARAASRLPLPHGACAPAPLHVPIPSPGDEPPGDTPPPVEDEPLPPV